MSIKTLKDSCNCIWKHCDHGQDVCSREALGFDCGHCEKIHWLGDGSLGEGVRLCTDCTGNVMLFLTDELTKFMHDLSPYVPDSLSSLESALRHYYLSFIERRDLEDIKDVGKIKAWETPIRDSRALIEFAGIVLQKSKTKEIHVEILERGIEIAKKHRDLMEAFSPVDLSSILKEEKSHEEGKH